MTETQAERDALRKELFRCPAAAHIACVIAADKTFGEFARTL